MAEACTPPHRLSAGRTRPGGAAWSEGGGIDGRFKGDRHLAFPDNTQRTSNMLLSILHLYDIELDKLGTSNGRLQPLEMV